MKQLAKFIALGFGSGMAPIAPGTFGTIVAIPLYLLIQDLALPIYLGIVAVTLVIGIWACQVYSDMLGVHDHNSIVWDEVVGYLITMVLAPPGWQWLLIGFIAFRFFDIAKPWPINLLDKHVKGGFGIMVDDVLAGVYGLLTVYGLSLYLEF